MVISMISNAVDSTLASITVTQACLAIVTVGLVIRWATKQKKNLPPGPPPMPILGNTLDLKGKILYQEAMKWIEKYGPIVMFYSGLQPTVVIGSLETLTEAYNQRAPDFADKPNTPSFDYVSGGSQNIAFAPYGPEFKYRRKIVMKSLRQYLTGTQHPDRVHEVVKMTVANMKKEGGPFDPHPHLGHNVFNILHNICFGYALTIEDPKFIEILQILDASLTQATGFWEDFFPVLLHYPTKAFKDFVAEFKKIEDYILDHVNKGKANFDQNSIMSIVDSILLAKKQTDEGDSEAIKAGFTDRNVVHMIVDIFVAGVDTTRNTLEWMFLVLASRSDVQKKIQDEIDTVVGDGIPGREHRLDLVYTEAFIMEAMRMFPVVPMGLPHKTLCDTQVGGFDVPANTHILVNQIMVTLNQYAILNDPKHWKNPEKFMPERYIEKGGEKLMPRPKSWIPFSVGQRNCVGEFLAKKNILYTLAGVLQKLSFTMAPGTKPDFDPKNHFFVINCKRYKVLATPRN